MQERLQPSASEGQKIETLKLQKEIKQAIET
jgi:hypothetical protein